MTTRSLSIAAAAGAARPRRHAAAAGVGAARCWRGETQAWPALVQQVASRYYRRYYRDNGTYVRAPFTEVDTRRRHLGRGAVRARLFRAARHLGAGALRQSLGSALRGYSHSGQHEPGERRARGNRERGGDAELQSEQQERRDRHASTTASTSSVERSGSQSRNGPCRCRLDLGEENVQREPQAQIENDADHGGGDAAQRAGEARVCAETLDIGRAGEDPQEAGREGRP